MKNQETALIPVPTLTIRVNDSNRITTRTQAYRWPRATPKEMVIKDLCNFNAQEYAKEHKELLEKALYIQKTQFGTIETLGLTLWIHTDDEYLHLIQDVQFKIMELTDDYNTLTKNFVEFLNDRIKMIGNEPFIQLETGTINLQNAVKNQQAKLLTAVKDAFIALSNAIVNKTPEVGNPGQAQSKQNEKANTQI